MLEASMHRATTLMSSFLLLLGLIVLVSAGAGNRARAADPKADEYEKERVERFADRIVRIVNTDHTRWMKTLEKAYPRQVTEPTDDDEYESWFNLLTGGRDEWRRVSSRNSEIAALFDRVVDYRRLGPVAQVSREDFMRYADRVLDRSRRRAAESVPEYDEEADRVFRVLDRDGNGEIYRSEMTTALEKAGLKGDPNANGRVDKNEYREFFQHLVAQDNEAALMRAARDDDDDDDDDDNDRRGPPRDDDKDKDQDAKVLPGWFAQTDADMDGQIALHEWRKANGAIDYFLEMDLNEDGLLTEMEYWRYVAMLDKRDWDDPPPDKR
jgi:Ca2+-binding EF-hand superfamily protein